MTKKTLSILFFAMLLPLGASAQKKKAATKKAVATATKSTTPAVNEETIYYDNNWKGVESPDDATFIRKVITPKDANYPTRYKDYYKSGELCGEGTLKSVNKYDDLNTIYIEGKKLRKDGSLEMTFKMNGKNKDVITYRQDGSKELEGTMVKNKFEGIVKEYANNEQAWIKRAYANGEIDRTKTEYTSNTVNGDVVRYNASNNKIIGKSVPVASDFKEEFDNGMRWTVIRKNGLEIGVCADRTRDYGGNQGLLAASIAKDFGKDTGKKDYIRVSVYINNNTAQSIKFDPSLITSTGYLKNKEKDIEWLSFADYTKSMDKAQSNDLKITQLHEENKAKEMATVSRSATDSHVDVYHKDEKSKKTATRQTSKSQSTSHEKDVHVDKRDVRETVDAEQYAKNMEAAREEVSKLNDELQAINESKRQGYLQPVQIDAFKGYSGYVYTRELKLHQIEYNIEIDGIIYPFIVKVSDVRN